MWWRLTAKTLVISAEEKTHTRTGTGRSHETTRKAAKVLSSQRANTTVHQQAELSGEESLEGQGSYTVVEEQFEDRCGDRPGYVL